MAMKSGVNEFRKLLLPAPTLWETIWSALKGVTAVATQVEDRQALEKMLTTGIINDAVLANSRHNSMASPGGSGSILVFSLFDSLHKNPLWQKHGFDAVEFLQGVRPALTNFMELMHQLRDQEIKQQLIKQQAEKDNEKTSDNEEEEEEDEISVTFENEDTGEAKTIRIEDLLNPKTEINENAWSTLAAKDPDSLAGALSKMTTPDYLEHSYFTTLVESVLASHLAPSPNHLPDYVDGSTKIHQVAILRARAMPLEDTTKKNYRYEEFEASDPDFESKQANRAVGAQIDVLFEVTHRYWETATAASILNENNNDDEDNKNEATKTTESSSSTAAAKVLVEQSQLGVAVLEGYLHNPKNLKEGLRWRIPLLREPWEFPNMESYGVKTILSEEEAAASDGSKKQKQ